MNELKGVLDSDLDSQTYSDEDSHFEQSRSNRLKLILSGQMDKAAAAKVNIVVAGTFELNSFHLVGGIFIICLCYFQTSEVADIFALSRLERCEWTYNQSSAAKLELEVAKLREISVVCLLFGRKLLVR